jgi:hypothetical protein
MSRSRASQARRRLSACVLALGVTGAHWHASASGADDKALAEALFDDGLKLMRDGRFEQACPKLEQSNRIDPGIGTLLYLGECYEKTGRSASAWAIFREAMSSAQAAGQSDRARRAHERAAALESSLSRLIIDADAEVRDTPGLTVKRDGKVLDASLWGVALPLDPGKYTIDVSAPGYHSWSTSVTIVPQGSTQTVRVPPLGKLPESASEPAARAVPETAEPRPLAPSGPVQAGSAGLSTQQTIGVVLGAVGVVGLGVGTYFGFRAISKNSDAELVCRGTRCASPEGVTLTEQAKDAALVSNVAFGTGAAFVISGMVLYLTGASGTDKARLTLTPLVASHFTALELGGSFQ